MVVSDAAFLAVDWGTTNRRVYAIADDGTVIATERDDRGVLSIAKDAFAAEVGEIRARFGDLPVICAGMVGSTRGWVEVPYAPCPATLDDLAARLTWVEPGRTAIVPGVAAASDVMRGEEVQVLGAVASGLVPGDALLCQPGTHCKWAQMTGGAIGDFRTTMTGELFALLQRHSLLADFMTGDVADGPDFRDGLALAREGTPLSALFGERAGVVLGHRAADGVAARVSGLLVGSDVAEQRLASGETVYILADARLGALYGAAVEAAGGVPMSIDSHAAFVAGITALWNAAHDR
ncbi:MAG: 2-dehydro-3-deoxygalactonokinase [Pseudomonadota bacterium]